jgi:hypothetical protein
MSDNDSKADTILTYGAIIAGLLFGLIAVPVVNAWRVGELNTPHLISVLSCTAVVFTVVLLVIYGFSRDSRS